MSFSSCFTLFFFVLCAKSRSLIFPSTLFFVYLFRDGVHAQGTQRRPRLCRITATPSSLCASVACFLAFQKKKKRNIWKETTTAKVALSVNINSYHRLFVAVVVAAVAVVRVLVLVLVLVLILVVFVVVF